VYCSLLKHALPHLRRSFPQTVKCVRTHLNDITQVASEGVVATRDQFDEHLRHSTSTHHTGVVVRNT